MLDFFETKPFNTACVGAVALATCYEANLNDWRLIVLAVALAIGFYFMFQKKAF